MFGQLTVAKRLALGFGVMVLLMVIVSVVGNQQVGFIDKTLTSVNQGAALKQRYAINFRGSVHDRAIAIRDAVLVNNEADLQKHLRDIERLARMYLENADKMAKMFSERGATEQERALLNAIQAIEDRTLSLTERVIHLRRNGNPEAARQFLLDEVSPA